MWNPCSSFPRLRFAWSVGLWGRAFQTRKSNEQGKAQPDLVTPSANTYSYSTDSPGQCRVLIVDASAVMREFLRDFVEREIP